MILWTRSVPASQTDDNDLAGQVFNQANAMVVIGKSLAVSASHVSQHTEQQVSHAESLTQAVRQMSESIGEIAASASQTADAAGRMNRLNEQCFTAMEELAESLGKVTGDFDGIATAMAQLRETSASVAKVVQVIGEIATQTKMLSLNASIEAAHAGDQGRGFAVVAQEVRELAERTRESAKEIEDVIRRNSALTEEVGAVISRGRETARESVEGAKSAVLALTGVSTEIETVNTRVQQIAAATGQQSATAEQVTASLDAVAAVARETLAESRQSCQAGEQVAQIAERIEARMGNRDLEFFGLTPLEDPVKMNKSFLPLCDWLRRALGHPLVVRLGHDYEDAVRDLGEGRSLIAYLTPSTYVEAHNRYDVEPLVVPLARGEPFYRAAIVVRADSGITSVEQLRGLRFAFGDPKSTGSKAMPEAMLRNDGLRLDDLAGHGFVGNHDNVASAVLAGQYDAGGLMLSVAERYAAQGLKILAVSEPIPQFPLCASPRLSAAERKRLRKMLVAITDPAILAALGAEVTGFAPIEDRDYDGVRAMLGRLSG